MKLPSLKIRNLEAKFPVIQAGMGVRIGMAELASAVVKCGGFGTIASVGMGDVERGKTHFVEECNEKLDSYKDEMLDLPKLINDANRKLMLLTMETCYADIHENKEQIDEISAWIDNVRVELKKNMIRKEEMQRRNQDLYAYMHDIFGADVIELFDMQFAAKENETNK